MSPTDWLVLISAAGAIALVNWYFLFSGRSRPGVAALAAAGGAQAATILVQGGYSPSVVEAASGRPLRLTFDRRETSGCSEEVVIPAFSVRRFLPAHQQTVVEVTPTAPGDYEFTCGMGMLRGTIRVK